MKVGRKKSKSYTMKGGAPTPYKYEGTDLTIGNPLTQIAINRNDDNRYDFNILGKKGTFGIGSTPDVVFNSFCELFQYYRKNNPISCVQQRYMGGDGKPKNVPSFVDILGLSLVLLSIKESYSRAITINYKMLGNAFSILFLMVNGVQGATPNICEEQMGGSESMMYINNFLQSKLLKELQKELPSYEVQYITPMPITKLDESAIRSVLTYFKQALFFYKYGPSIVPPPTITFASMQTPEDAFRALGFDATFEIERGQFEKNRSASNFAEKINLYTGASLKSALESAAGSARMGGGKRKRTTIKKTKRMRTRKMRRTKRKH